MIKVMHVAAYCDKLLAAPAGKAPTGKPSTRPGGKASPRPSGAPNPHSTGRPGHPTGTPTAGTTM